MSQFSQAQDTVFLEETKLVHEVLVEKLTIPWDMNWGPDGWIWFNERDGHIYRLNPDTKELQEIYVISETFQSWDNSGFHAFALHPEFPMIPYIYTHYTYDDYGSRLVRYTFSFDENTMVNPLVLMDQIPGNSSHNGSRILFDKDYNILLAMGDAFNNIEAQKLNNVSGKILCLDQAGNPCPDNPYPDNFIYSYGHRNPQGLCYGRDSIIYSSEHGEATDDELNVIFKGKNYGWPLIEGYCDYLSEQAICDTVDLEEPIFIWTPSAAPCGLAYFDHESIPEWRHSLIQTFLKDKRISVLPLTEDGLAIKDDTEWKIYEQRFGRIRDVLVTPNGRLFICTSNEETNGQWVPKDDYDKIIEVINPDYQYPSFIPEVGTFEAQVFPNPATDNLWISLNTQEKEVEIEITDLQGNLIFQETKTNEIFDGFWQLILPEMQSGVYALNCYFGSEKLSKKIVIAN